MYLKKAIYDNVGPLKDVCIEFSFNNDGTPIPAIIVGENGSGKSTFASNIVDAFYEMAGKAFSNALQPASSGRIGHLFFKAISGGEISLGSPYMVSFLLFESNDNQKHYKYLFKSGDISLASFVHKYNIEIAAHEWINVPNGKNISIGEDDARSEWSNNIFCHFGPDRYERPFWMGKEYYDSDESRHPSVMLREEGILNNPISVKNVNTKTLQWLLDIITDSRTDVTLKNQNVLMPDHVNIKELLLLQIARRNIETILSKIVGEDIYFALNYRTTPLARFSIKRTADNSTFCYSLDSLSTGQLALFNLFTTIVRYADINNLNMSINLSNITGIVVIDEIELHLHSNLQKEILPELIKLFPKVQFIITTHSPFFLLGMEEKFGKDIDVFEMPSARRINIEDFSEFNKVYEYIKQTSTYNDEFENELRAVKADGETIIVTEGLTDWKHIEAAYKDIESDDRFKDIVSGLNIKIYEYGLNESNNQDQLKQGMGNKRLLTICDNMSRVPRPNKYIFIFDRDDETINNKSTHSHEKFKYWGNNVYSFILPVPPHRKDTPNICIEHLYRDEELKKEWVNPEDHIPRRLYIGNEFDKFGHSKELKKFCENKNICGENNISIIDGSKGKRVLDIENPVTNYALSKSKFAELVLNREPPFDHFNFESFVPIFSIIREIDKRETEHV